MSVLESILNWRLYLRNRLHRGMERAGWERLQKYGVIGEKKLRPLDLIISLDNAQISLCKSIECYAVNNPEMKALVDATKSNTLNDNLAPKVFSETFFQHYCMTTEFIHMLSESDLQLIPNPQLFENAVTVQWLIEFSNFYEQSITERMMHLLRQHEPTFHVPWSTERYMVPVTPPQI